MLVAKPRIAYIIASLIIGYIYRHKKEWILYLYRIVFGRCTYSPSASIVKNVNQLAISKKLEEKLGPARPFQHRDFYQDHFIRAGIYNDEMISYAQSYYSSNTLACLVKIENKTCGHRGIIHGGLCAALFDDILGELLYCGAEGKYMGVTASLTINYRQPMPANKIYVFYVKAVKREGRKVFMNGQVRDTNKLQDTAGKVRSEHDHLFADMISTNTVVYAEADALFITK